jgi:hypothetical protein
MRYEEKSRSDTFLKKHLSHAFEITMTIIKIDKKRLTKFNFNR